MNTCLRLHTGLVNMLQRYTHARHCRAGLEKPIGVNRADEAFRPAFQLFEAAFSAGVSKRQVLPSSTAFDIPAYMDIHTLS